VALCQSDYVPERVFANIKTGFDSFDACLSSIGNELP